MLHELKTDPDQFDLIAVGEKTFEFRRDDRNYMPGDTLHLLRTQYSAAQMAAGAPLEYTGVILERTISHVMRGTLYGLPDGFAILSLAMPWNKYPEHKPPASGYYLEGYIDYKNSVRERKYIKKDNGDGHFDDDGRGGTPPPPYWRHMPAPPKFIKP